MANLIPPSIPENRGSGLKPPGSLLPALSSAQYLGLTTDSVHNISMHLGGLTNIPQTSLKQRDARAFVESVSRNDCDPLKVTRDRYRGKPPKELAAIQQALSRQGEFLTTGEANEKGEYTVAPDLWGAIGCFVESELVAHLREKQTGEGFYLAAKGLYALLDICHADTELHDAVLQLCCHYLTRARNINPHHPGATYLLIKLSPNTVAQNDKTAFLATSHRKYYQGIDEFRAGNFSKASKLLTKFCTEQKDITPADYKRVEKATATILKAEAKILAWDKEALLQEDGAGDKERVYTTIIENLRKSTLSMSESISTLLRRIEEFCLSVKNLPESRYMQGIAAFLQSCFSNSQETKTEKLHTAAGLGNPDAILSLRLEQVKEKAQQCALHYNALPPKGKPGNNLNQKLANILDYSRKAGLSAEQILSVVDVIKISGGEPTNKGWSEICLKRAFQQYITLSFSNHPQPSLSDSEGFNEENLRVGWEKWERDSWLVKLWEVGKKNDWLPQSDESPMLIQMPLLDERVTVSPLTTRSVDNVYNFLSQKGMSALRPEELFTALKRKNFDDYNFTSVSGDKGRTIFHRICTDPSMARWALGPVMKVAKSMNVPVQCLSTLDSSGHTPLTIAIALHDIRSVRAMIHQGACLSTVYQPGTSVTCTTKHSLPVCNPLFVAYHAGHRMMDLVLSCILDETQTGNCRQLRSLDVWTALRIAKLSSFVEERIGNQTIITHREAWENINTKLQHLAKTAKAGIYTGQLKMTALHLSFFTRSGDRIHDKHIVESMASLTPPPGTHSFGSAHSLNRDAQPSLGRWSSSLTTLKNMMTPHLSSLGKSSSLTTLDLPNLSKIDTLTTLDHLPKIPDTLTNTKPPPFASKVSAPPLGRTVADNSISPLTWERQASAPPELGHTTTKSSVPHLESEKTLETTSTLAKVADESTTLTASQKILPDTPPKITPPKITSSKSQDPLPSIDTLEKEPHTLILPPQRKRSAPSVTTKTEFPSTLLEKSFLTLPRRKTATLITGLSTVHHAPLKRTNENDQTNQISAEALSGIPSVSPPKPIPGSTKQGANTGASANTQKITPPTKERGHAKTSPPMKKQTPFVITPLPKPISGSTQQGANTGASAKTQKTPPTKERGHAKKTPLQPKETPNTGGSSTPANAGKKESATPSPTYISSPKSSRSGTKQKDISAPSTSSQQPPREALDTIHRKSESTSSQKLLTTADTIKVKKALESVLKAHSEVDKRNDIVFIQACIKTRAQYIQVVSLYRILQPPLENIIPYNSLPPD